MSDTGSIAIPVGGAFVGAITLWATYIEITILAIIGILCIAFMSCWSAFTIRI